MYTVPNEYQFNKAREALTIWTIRRAHRLAKDIGFSYEPVASGHPETYEAVLLEYGQCMRQRRGFRVWSGASDNTVYTNPEGNYAFRFIHDIFHAVFKLDWSYASEMAVAQRHIAEVSNAFGASSIEAQLIAADTLWQVKHYANTGKFVENQLEFARERICA